MKTIWKPLSDILTSDRIVPVQIGQPEKSEDEEGSENQNPIDQFSLGRKVHENARDQTGFECGYQHADRHVRFAVSEVHVGQKDR